MFELIILAESVGVTASDHPWWISAMTGSGGALVVLMLWVKSLSVSLSKKDNELLQISKESIECITKILERHNQDKPWKAKLEALIQEIHSCLKDR